jgi:predicted RNA-binding Zn-ribbon protein involved in translation (DUF1610 family)
MTHICPNCGPLHLTVAEQLGAKAACAIGAAVLGSKFTKDPLLQAVLIAGGVIIGHKIDQQCPHCGVILEAVQLLSPGLNGMPSAGAQRALPRG